MDESTSPRAAETALLVESYAALNRNDIPGALEAFDEQIEWIEPVEFPGGRSCHGIEDVTAHLSRARDRWAEGACEPERFIAAGDRIIAMCHVHVRLTGATEWIDGRLADVYTFRDGKVVQKRTFGDPRQALEWSGVSATEAS
jgi:ketosteroid isomerase-like protein